MNDAIEKIQRELFQLSEIDFKKFNCKLMPTVNPERVIGVRTPALRKFAKRLSETPEAEIFLHTLPHKYFEENNIHGFLISKMKDYETVIAELQKFLPYVDNWATCDLISPKIFKKHLPETEPEIQKWIGSEHIYTIRFGIKMLMDFYLDEAFKPKYPEWAARIRSEEYYVNMMVAWYFATALAKQYEIILPYIEKQTLDIWTHNKTIQKAIESYRITDKQKAYLRTLKIKKKEINQKMICLP